MPSSCCRPYLYLLDADFDICCDGRDNRIECSISNGAAATSLGSGSVALAINRYAGFIDEVVAASAAEDKLLDG
jgi:hypothetical protein